MVLTPSNMLPIGTPAPEFELYNPATDQMQMLESIKGEKATVIFFICNHCPYVVHIHEGLIQIGQDYADQGIAFIGINANDVANYPDDSPDKMANQNYPFPYLYDETQATAKAYDAACTPDCYIFDQDLKLTYRGQFDDARPGNDIAVTGQSVRAAIDAIITGNSPDSEQKPSIGCNIKWK